MKTKEDVLKVVKESNIELIRFLTAGNDGVIRGRVVTIDSLEGSLEAGSPGSICVPFFSALDLVPPGSPFGCVGELTTLPDLDTLRILPYVPNTAMLICDFRNKADLSPSELCARSALKNLLNSTDYEAKCSFENELYLLTEDEEGHFTAFEGSLYCSSTGMNAGHPVISDLIRALKQQGLIVERYYPEYGGGQYEVIYRYSGALRAADNQLIFRETTRGVARNHGLVASFMPKPFQHMAGSGAHFHISLWKDGQNLFYDKGGEYGLSEKAKHFIGGILQHLPAICAFTVPTVTSYKRLVPHGWASAFGCYGPDNREAAIRIVEGIKGNEAGSFHLEFKAIDPTCNPYLALTVVLAAGIEGIEKKVDPGKALDSDPGDMTEPEREKLGVFRLPETLGEAIEALRADGFFRAVLGDIMVDEYIKVKRHNWVEYIQQVTEWEIEKYIDIF
jgi:glutamine synthetase